MGQDRTPKADGYIPAWTRRTLHPGDTLRFSLRIPTSEMSSMDYTYNYFVTSSTTYSGGWYTLPQGGQPPMWSPYTGTLTAGTAPPTNPPPNTKWLLPVSGPTATSAVLTTPAEPLDEPLDETVRKQIEDAKLSPHAALVGYRAWVVDIDNDDGPMLKSLISPAFWPYRKELCAHRLDPENKGFWGGTPNGIHAARSAEHLVTMGYEGMAKVTGEVYLWGRVIHGKLGYRAEKAYPKLIRASRNYWWLKILAERYGIPYEIG